MDVELDDEPMAGEREGAGVAGSGGCVVLHDCEEPVFAVAFSPFREMPFWLAFATASQLTLCTYLRCPRCVDGGRFQVMSEVRLPSRTLALSWSRLSQSRLQAQQAHVHTQANANAAQPQSQTPDVGVSHLVLCAAGEDDTLRVIECIVGAEGGDFADVTVAVKHEGYIVAAAFSPSGEFLASISEAGTLGLWAVQIDPSAAPFLLGPSSLHHLKTLNLLSCPVSLSWRNPGEEGTEEVVVGESRGTCTPFSLPSCAPLVATHTASATSPATGILPLVSSDTFFTELDDASALTASRVAALGEEGRTVLFWDAQASDVPFFEAPVPESRLIRWSHVSDEVFATAGRDAVHVFRVCTEEDGVPHLSLSEIKSSDGQATDITWHATINLFVASLGSCVVLLVP